MIPVVPPGLDRSWLPRPSDESLGYSLSPFGPTRIPFHRKQRRIQNRNSRNFKPETLPEAGSRTTLSSADPSRSCLQWIIRFDQVDENAIHFEAAVRCDCIPFHQRLHLAADNKSAAETPNPLASFLMVSSVGFRAPRSRSAI